MLREVYSAIKGVGYFRSIFLGAYMADELQDKTEEATPKKLSDARKKGQVSKSQDLTTSVVLIGGMLILLVFSSMIFQMLSSLFAGIFRNLGQPFASFSSVVFWFKQGLFFLVTLLAPIFIVVFVLASMINVYQVNLVFSHHPLIPKWENINIFNVKKFKKFFELQAIMRLLFGLLKLSVVGFVCYFVILSLLSDISELIYANPKELLFFLSKNAFFIGLTISTILIVLGIIDFTYQKWKFSRDQKMTKQEVKEERKQTEGDVHVKSKMRSMMQLFTQSRMKANVPKSDVVIANPIHYAIAIKYDPEVMSAPVCLAKGARKMALAIKEIARESEIPIVENPLLARGLYKAVNIGEFIPSNFYYAIAEVLAYVYRLNEKIGKKALPPTLEETVQGNAGGSSEKEREEENTSSIY